MRYPFILVAAFTIAACQPAVQDADVSSESTVEAVTPPEIETDVRLQQASKLMETALVSKEGYKITESLTTEVGQRMAGTEAEARARVWAAAKFKEIGLENVRIEPFTIPGWERGAETAYIISPYPQKLEITALGYSVATPVNLSLIHISEPTRPY